MGKQIRFYTLPEDEKLLLEFIFRDLDIEVIIENSFDGPNPRLLDKQKLLMGNDIQNRNLLLRHKNVPLAPFIEQYTKQKLDIETNLFVDTQEKAYRFSKSKASVIEFGRSFIKNKNKLIQGRMWAEMRYWDERDNLIYKGVEFEAWYDSIARWLRRNFSRVENRDGYFGRFAKQWLLEERDIY